MIIHLIHERVRHNWATKQHHPLLISHILHFPRVNPLLYMLAGCAGPTKRVVCLCFTNKCVRCSVDWDKLLWHLVKRWWGGDHNHPLPTSNPRWILIFSKRNQEAIQEKSAEVHLWCWEWEKHRGWYSKAFLTDVVIVRPICECQKQEKEQNCPRLTE